VRNLILSFAGQIDPSLLARRDFSGMGKEGGRWGIDEFLRVHRLTKGPTEDSV
jgi:hypothetical protein